MNLVMLDVDGTLTQSYEYDREIFGFAIAEVIGCRPGDIDLDKYINTTSIGVTLEAFQRIKGRDPNEQEVMEVRRKVISRLEKLYQESPRVFGEVPGAKLFLERLSQLTKVRLAIATGGWQSEAMFKLRASGLTVDGIPLATSDDHMDRKMIMRIAAQKARDYYHVQEFGQIVYLGDGSWDWQASISLGFGFIGIGSRVKALRDSEKINWHQDYQDLNAVIDSIGAFFNGIAGI